MARDEAGRDDLLFLQPPRRRVRRTADADGRLPALFQVLESAEGPPRVTLVLRPYQVKAVDDVRQQYQAGRRAPVLVMPTGAGKTQVAAWIIRAALDRGNRTLFCAGRTELLDQTVSKLNSAGVDSVRLIQASRDVGPKDAEVTVASIQTLTTRRWQDNLPPAELVILDECHHGAATTWARVLNQYPTALRLGLTATPERADGKPLGDLFDCLVTGPSVSDLTAAGHLVECIAFPPAGGSRLDATEIALDPVAAYQRNGNGERAVAFCRSRIHAQRTEAEFLSAGIECAVIDGTMTRLQRRDTLARFRAGELRVLSSVGVLTEGWDDPGCSVAILLRGFEHPGLYIQCIGRILRPYPGKQQARLIDLVGSFWDHGSPDIERVYSLDGKAITKAVREEIKQCRKCGACYRSGQRCPGCGAEQEVMPFTSPVSTGVGLVEVKGPVAPKAKRDYVMTITAQWPGRCEACQRPINRGDEILWTTVSRRSKHRTCTAGVAA